MSPSSLVFLLIVAIWAAYLLQHWVRRREHLATARSVDRFSEGMRVLERREPWLASPADAPEHRSYAVSPVRAAPSGAAGRHDRPQPPSGHRGTDRAAARDDGEAERHEGRGRQGGRGARRVRAVLLVLAVLALLALAVLVPVLSLPRWAPAAAGGVVVADLLWLRAAARRSAGRRSAPHRSATHRSATHRSATHRNLGTSPPTSGLSGGSRDFAPEQPGVPQVRRPLPEALLHDDLAGDHSQPVRDADASAPQDDKVPDVTDPRRWQPVPVPPPTYTLKARAERSTPAPVPAVDTVAAPEETFDGCLIEGEVAQQVDGGVDYSRVPTSELPFDGYALDEDLEDLPAVYQAV